MASDSRTPSGPIKKVTVSPETVARDDGTHSGPFNKVAMERKWVAEETGGRQVRMTLESSHKPATFSQGYTTKQVICF